MENPIALTPDPRITDSCFDPIRLVRSRPLRSLVDLHRLIELGPAAVPPGHSGISVVVDADGAPANLVIAIDAIRDIPGSPVTDKNHGRVEIGKWQVSIPFPPSCSRTLRPWKVPPLKLRRNLW